MTMWISTKELLEQHAAEDSRRFDLIQAALISHDQKQDKQHADNSAKIDKVNALLFFILLSAAGGLLVALWDLLKPLHHIGTGG